MLLDLGLGVARDYGLTFELGAELRSLYTERLKIDLSRFNGDQSWELPIPATCVIDTDGTVVYASVHPDYTQRPEPSEILQAIP